MVNLVKRHPVEELVGKLNSGKTISKEQVVRESRLSQAQKSTLLILTVNLSDKQVRRRRNCSDILNYVSEVPSVDAEN